MANLAILTMVGPSIKYAGPAAGVVPALWLFLLVAFATIHEFLCILQILHLVPRIMGRPPVLPCDEVFHDSPFSASVFAYFLLIKKVFGLIFSLVGIFIIDHRFLSLFPRPLVWIRFLRCWFGSKKLGEHRLEIFKVSSHTYWGAPVDYVPKFSDGLGCLNTFKKVEKRLLVFFVRAFLIPFLFCLLACL